MAKVIGVGGVFFKCQNPQKVRDWYKKNLGFEVNQWGTLFKYDKKSYESNTGYLQWSPFNEDTDYFNPSQKEFMINYRVDKLEELKAQLEKNGVTICDTIETYEYGKFLHILDCENNKIELWEPTENGFG